MSPIPCRLTDRQRPDNASVPEDCHSVSQREHFFQAMRNVDDRDTLRSQTTQNLEEPFRLLQRQCTGRLIQDEDPDILREGTRDLHELLLGNTESPDRLPRIDRCANTCQDLCRLVPDTWPIDCSRQARSLGKTSEKDVFPNGERIDDAQFLINDSDSVFESLARVTETNWPTLQQNLSLVRLQRAGKDFHECRLACTVLPDDREHLTAEDRQRDTLQSHHPRKALRNLAGFQDRLSHIPPPAFGKGAGRAPGPFV
jgi:hypothetical protein